MKKYLTCILSTLVLLQAIVLPISAVSLMEVTLSDASGKAGEYVELDLSINSTVPAKVLIISFNQKLIDAYDEDKLELVEFTDAGKLVTDSMLYQLPGSSIDTVLNVEEKTISLVYSVVPDPFEGKICTVKFKIKDGVKPDDIPVTMSVSANYGEEEVSDELISVQNAVITVYEDISTVPVTGVSLNRTSLELSEGATATLNATVAPSNASNKAVSWSSDRPGVATVDANGKVTAVSSGTATITVTTVDGNKAASCRVSVTHTHDWSDTYSKNYTHHWFECSGCDEVTGKAVHTWDSGVETTPATETTTGIKTYTCTLCGQTKVETIPALGHTHDWSDTYSKNDTHHWFECSGCDEVTGKAVHTWDSGVETTPATETTTGIKTYTCTLCGQTKVETIPALGHTHDWSDTYSKNDTHHWFECSGCDEVTGKEEHADKDRNGKCDACGYTIYDKSETEPKRDTFDHDSWYLAVTQLRNQRYTLKASASKGGSITPSGISKIKYDGKLTYTITPDEGYEIGSVTVDGKDVGAVSEYTFKNVQKAHTISVVFNETEVNDVDDVRNEAIFADVDSSDWFYEDVEFVFENELMIGTSETEFSPYAVVDRAMLVTILWRLEGSPIVEASSKFTDVPDDEWYTDAVNWASANGIVNGYGDGIFGAMNYLTREQIMAILNRYAAYKGITDEAIPPMLPQYTYSTWAENNVIWADMNGMLDDLGVDVSDLTGAATRAEMAAYLRRFCENIAG